MNQQTPPRTLQEAVDRLTIWLSFEDKAQITARAKDDLFDLHFGIGNRIREDFGLWGSNPALLLDCQRASLGGAPNIPDAPSISADEASMVILCALWDRLRH